VTQTNRQAARLSKKRAAIPNMPPEEANRDEIKSKPPARRDLFAEVAQLAASASAAAEGGRRRTFYSYVAPQDTDDGRVWVEWFQKVRLDLAVPDTSGRSKTFKYRWRMQPTHVWIYTKRPRSDELIYNLPAVLDAVVSGETIYWAEGEKDADNLAAAGVVATSHHGGAGHVIRTQTEWLTDHRGLIALLYDLDADDKGGGNKGAFDVVRRYDLLREVGVPRERIAVGHARVGKDVSDHLAAGYGLDELVWLEDLTGLYEKAAKTTAASYPGSGYSVPSNWGAKLGGGRA